MSEKLRIKAQDGGKSIEVLFVNLGTTTVKPRFKRKVGQLDFYMEFSNKKIKEIR